MSGTATVVIVVVVVLAVVALGLLVAAGLRERRSQELRTRFGPEYERAIEAVGDRQVAERELRERVERRQELSIRQLDPASRQRYAEEWRRVQTRFVDDPREAVDAADELLTRLMRDLGYPDEGVEQRVADVSVDHAEAADAYRRGRQILGNARGQVATDDLRQGMVLYRKLFMDLLGEPAGAVVAADRAEAAGEAPAPESSNAGTHREAR
jgi:hypothetical protein